MKPQISVIIPAYNAERYLAAAVSSVLAQIFPADEIIVVDDGSGDATPAVARQLPVHYHHQTNSGAAAARNQGIRLARGSWFAFLDADDLWTPEKLAAQTKSLTAQPNLDMIFGQVEQFSSPDALRSARPLPDRLQKLNGYVPGTLLIRREAFARLGYFDERWQAGYFFEWFARAQDAGATMAMLPQVVLRRRLHDDNLGLRRQDAAQREYLSVMKTILDRRRDATKQ